MKRKILSIMLIVASLAALAAPASALGTICGEASTRLAENVELAKGVFYTDDRQEEHYIIYAPNPTVRPVVVYGEKLPDKGDFKSFASLLEGRGWNVVCGVNGDYYVVATALPVGAIISEGELIASDAGNWALGFRADGTAFFGKPALSGRVYIDTETYRLGGINQTIRKDDYYLYTDDFGADTGSAVPTSNVVFSYPEDCPNPALTPNCEFELTVESVFDSEGPVPIPEGKLVLSLIKGSDGWRTHGLACLAPGEKVRMQISSEALWSEADYAIGSLYRLVDGGVRVSGLDEIDDKAAPRTAVGIRPDGTVIFYTVDGRQAGYSGGLTLSEVADRLIELGCIEAGALDGGGSTNIQARYPGDGAYTPVNSPSLGKEREVTSYIMLASDLAGSGEAKTLSIRPYDAVMLAGSSLRMAAGACDETGRPVLAPSGGHVLWSADGGSITTDGLLTAPAEEAVLSVTAVYGNLSDSVPVRVIKTPDLISVLNEETGRKLSSLTLEVGQKTELSAEALWRNLAVSAGDGDFIWSVAGSIGTIDEDGSFEASQTGGAGCIAVSAGDCLYELPVVVKTGIMTGDGFESVEGGASEGVVWSQEIAPDYVRYGFGSLKAVYDLSEGPATIPLSLDWAGVSKYAALWIYGDGSGNKIYVNRKDTEVLAAELDFTGWRQFTVPTASGGISGLTIAGAGAGTLWFDQLLLTDHETPDLEAPYITLSINKLMVAGSVMDAVDGCLDASNISLTLDGEPIPFQYDGLTGDVYAAIEESGEIRRLTLTARDASGNIHSASASTEGQFESVFGDMGGHWAEDYVNYMRKLGVVVGVEDGGGLIFEPDKRITRAQFAVMICRRLKIDAESYADMELGFADAAEIPSWAANYVKAAAALGIIKGIAEDGGLYFRPNAELTRAQAMTVLGRTLEGGRMSADLCFADVAAIPSWALGYVSKLVFAGVIRGYDDNTLRPNDGLTRAQICKILTEMT